MKTVKQIKMLEAALEQLFLIQDSLIQKINSEYTEELHTNIKNTTKEIITLEKRIRDLRATPEVGKFANEKGYTDTEPFEIIKIVSDKTIEIRAMSCRNVTPKDKLKFHIGGFAANCSNQQDQEWEITSNPIAETIRIRKTKKGWTKGSRKFYISDRPIKFYDYNF